MTVVDELARLRVREAELPVLAIGDWKTNAELIVGVVRLGYLSDDTAVLDVTYGKGAFWKAWRPTTLVGHDIALDGVDFTHLPYADGRWNAVVFDPPYKLNGTPTAVVDARYGVEVYTSREDRHRLMRAGMVECARVLAPGGILLVKCQDQVEGGKVRWQTDMLTEAGRGCGLEKVDALLFRSGRPQPARTRKDGKESVQQHARRNYSTLLVFRKLAVGYWDHQAEPSEK